MTDDFKKLSLLGEDLQLKVNNLVVEVEKRTSQAALKEARFLALQKATEECVLECQVIFIHWHLLLLKLGF